MKERDVQKRVQKVNAHAATECCGTDTSEPAKEKIESVCCPQSSAGNVSKGAEYNDRDPGGVPECSYPRSKCKTPADVASAGVCETMLNLGSGSIHVI